MFARPRDMYQESVKSTAKTLALQKNAHSKPILKSTVRNDVIVLAS